MTGNRITFEVQVYSTDHWVIDRSFPSEAEARKHGKKLFTNPRCAGYRIVRNWEASSRRHFETEILAEFRPLSDTLTVTPIEDAPVCTTDDQYYGVESRMAIGRLLRSYVERAVVTPTEIMHNYSELKRLLDKDSLVSTAVARVASLQGGKTGGEGQTRRDEMNQAIGRIAERARIAMAQTDLPDLKAEGMAAIHRELSQRLPPNDLAYFCLVVLSRDLVQMRNWLFKLDFLVDLMNTDLEKDGEPLALLDGVCADILGAPSVLPALLSPQRALLEKLNQIIDLCQGRLVTGDLPTDHRLVRLNSALTSPMLSQCRTVLFDLARREIKGTHPLSFSGGEDEHDAFIRLLGRLTDASGVLGGGDMAEALAIRFSRTLPAGGATSRREAIAGILTQYPDATSRVRYLLTLRDSEIGRQHATDIVNHLRSLIEHAPDAYPFIDTQRPLAESLDRISGLYDLTLASALEASERDRLAAAIDRMLARHIVDYRVVNQLDQPDEPLRDRANHLVRLCAPGVLRSPYALETVRALVIGHLRQPGFQERYTEGLTDLATRQQALRDFHTLLSAAGFC